MMQSLFWTIAGLVMAGGGLWIAALFVPTIAVLLKAALDFLRSPLGAILGVGALGFLLFSSGWIAGDIDGSGTTRAEWAADVAAKAKAAAEREVALRLEMSAAADAATATDQTFTKSIDEKVDSYVAKNPVRPECRATRDDIGRLLSIQ